ncbi:MAG TPA: EamA family transporter [Candidatus Sulfomarinibacteraceae bacterium]|nr:EamA family transporter [Candidatus Sulfomarinibacteraceae bacterium]
MSATIPVPFAARCEKGTTGFRRLLPAEGPNLSLAALLAILAALANAAQAVISKGLTARLPARQLIGVLYVCNALILLPAAPFVVWRWSPTIVALHLVSVALMAITAIAVWDMLDAGAASATTTATALSPIPAAIGTALLVPGTFRPIQAVAAVLVTVAVLAALTDAFGPLGRRGTWLRVLGAACGSGLLTVATRLMGDQGVGLVETYVVRTGLAAAVFLVLFPPRDIPWVAGPRLFGRGLVVTTYFVLLILAAQQGSPTVVQTCLAATPLLVLAWESWRARLRPPIRILLATVLVVVGVGLSLFL